MEPQYVLIQHPPKEQPQYVYTRWPWPKLYQKRKYRVYCYKCGEFGYWGERSWTRNKYGNKYQQFCIRHYDSEVFHKQMIRYKNHEIKSRPNGQRRCYMPRVDLVPVNNNKEFYFVCCYLGYGKRNYSRMHRMY